jgi:two-component system chemotaxis sensor kinase CheA
MNTMDTINTYAMLTDPEMKEILESFLVETKEILEKLDVDLIDMEKKPDDDELLNQIFRSFHTIKGTSGFFGLDKLTKVTHKCEDILNKLRKGEAKLNPAIMDAILSAYDKIKELLVCIETSFNEDTEIENVITILDKVLTSLDKKKASKKPAAAKKSKKNIKNESLPEIENIEENKEEEKVVGEPAVVKKAEINTTTAIKQTDNSIRVDIERLDELLTIVSELVLGRNRLAQVNSEFALENEGTKFSHDFSEATKQIDLMTNELQLVVMKTRMVKIGKVFNRFPRVVRDLSKESGKNVQLVLKGEETELDKTLIEEINDPLVHLVRNSIDHAIELPEEREKAGKSKTASIILSAEHEGNHIIITVEDDGKGIDSEVIKEKAISKGLISKEKSKELTQTDIFNLIFLPGFSTAKTVTKISGRGVGMDVVKTNVTKLRGLINVESKPGVGTKIIIKLPLTLAIIPGMIVKVNNQSFVIPLNSVIEVLRVHSDNIKTINSREVIKIRDTIIPLIDVNELISSKDKNEYKIWQYVVVVGIAEKRFGIKVDELIGQKEIVIKSLGSYLGNIGGIAGSTIMGDGAVVMILDISELINKLEA